MDRLGVTLPIALLVLVCEIEMSGIVHRLRIRNASQVVTVCAKGERVLRGGEMGSVAMLEREEGKGRGVGVVVDEGGKIAAVGYDSEIDAAMAGGRGRGGEGAGSATLLPSLY